MLVEPVSVRDAVQEVLGLVAPLAAPRRIGLEVDVPTMAGRFVRADRQGLRQILLDIVGNAVQHNRDGGRARVWCEAKKGERLRIVVSDTGPGMPADQLQRLFADVAAMSGEVGMTSEAGRGSRFYIELPEGRTK